jgi:5-formyltetrahydrofolate cyclo-ligase
MVGPSPPSDIAEIKAGLRKHYRALRREHVAAFPKAMRALLFLRPPVPLATRIAPDACIGLYYPQAFEAPTLSYARWLHENGRKVALPRFAHRDAPMAFHGWAAPYDEGMLEAGPFGVLQPDAESEPVTPQVLMMPLLAFTAQGARLGQGGGHYDRWLEAHPQTLAIGLAWDAQLADSLPEEPHDHPLAMVVTPTRLYEGAR